MNYSGLASQVASLISSFESFVSKVNSVDLTSVWTGTASTSISEKLDTCCTNAEKQIALLGRFQAALEFTQKYLDAKQEKTRLLAQLNGLDPEASNYSSLYNNLKNAIDVCTNNMNTYKNGALVQLSGIVSLTSSTQVISFQPNTSYSSAVTQLSSSSVATPGISSVSKTGGTTSPTGSSSSAGSYSGSSSSSGYSSSSGGSSGYSSGYDDDSYSSDYDSGYVSSGVTGTDVGDLAGNKSIEFLEGGMSIPLYYQEDYGDIPLGNTSDVAEGGCGFAACSMVISYLTGKAITPREFVDDWSERYFIDDVGMSWSLPEAAAEHYGVGSVEETTDINRVIEALKNNQPVISSQGYGTFSPGEGHIIVLRGVTEDGLILVNDPYKGNSQNNATAFDPSVVNENAAQYWIFEAKK